MQDAPQNAPLYNDIAQGPEGGRAFWLSASDGVTLRAAHWPAAPDTTGRGSIFLFPGRTEYIEKYGLIAAELAQLGYDTLMIDWRGQGLSDRPDKERALGHVGHFSEYQLDVQAFLALAKDLDLPKPWCLLGHSMGGCIGLRALHEGLPVDGAVFSAPMWGIAMAPALRPVAWSLSWALHISPFSQMLTPGTTRETYLALAPFEDNLLTTDPAMYDYMRRQAEAHPELTLGGPTAGWLYAALSETRALMTMPPPAVPTTTFLGTCERIVMPAPIISYMKNWDNGVLITVDGAEHEVLMEAATTRQKVYDALDRLAQTEPA
ncbi:alpha/beta fold hydrolase [Aliiroseovarius crassostreae]|uniref:alpha/beta fold hydrolase n=1 Tax=Aliiroseovarius crassostreae TaxID=154981 RepID=UPI003C7C131E